MTRMSSAERHRHASARPVRVGLITVSDTRTHETDESGALAAKLLEEAGHSVSARVIVTDEPTRVRTALEGMLAAGAEVVVTHGGTGIAARDTTYEALAGHFDKTLVGFGELFRALSFEQVGAAAMLSRATAGTWPGAGVVVVLPGSPDAARLAWEQILLPELGHLAKLGARGGLHGAPPTEPAQERAPSTLTHLDARGQARMVDVGDKSETVREARAQAVVSMSEEAFALLYSGDNKKGDVLATARIAGIQASKRTWELIPLCHAIALTSASVELELDPSRHAVRIVATARTTDRTGVEMEALVAANVAALTVYDMLKAADRTMSIGEVVLLEKRGGRSGHYVR